jgi:hypothetical protein
MAQTETQVPGLNGVRHSLNSVWSSFHHECNFGMLVLFPGRICQLYLHCCMMLHSGSEVGMCYISCSLTPSLLFPFSCHGSLVFGIECAGVLQVLRGCCRFDGWHQKAWKMECSQATPMCGVTVWYCGRWLPWHPSPIRWISVPARQQL